MKDNPAFPIPNSRGETHLNASGLTKLEYYAGLAMQGLCVNMGRNRFNDEEAVAKGAVSQAKALIAELEKESGQ